MLPFRLCHVSMGTLAAKIKKTMDAVAGNKRNLEARLYGNNWTL
ncbi:MAG: hypothetical protein WBJ35_00765 [Acetomicrobium sp.]